MIAVLLLALLWQGTGPEGVKASLSIDREEASVDQPIMLSVEVEAPEGYRLDHAALRSGLLKHIGFGPPPFVLQEEKIYLKSDGVEKAVYILDPELPGKHFLTPRQLVFRGGNRPDIVMETGVFPVQVRLPEPDPDFQPRTYPPLPLEARLLPEIDPALIPEPAAEENMAVFEERKTPWKIAAVFLMAAAGYWAFMALKNRKKREPPFEERIKSAREKALKSLKEHKNCAYAADTVRYYFEAGYGIPALTLTTRELLALKPLLERLGPEGKERLKKILYAGDKMKFAGYAPSPEENREAVENAESLIQ